MGIPTSYAHGVAVYTAAALRALVAGHLDLTEADLTQNALLAEDLAVDSLGAIELAMTLEDTFDVSLPDTVLSGVHTYGDLERVVAAQAGSPAPR